MKKEFSAKTFSFGLQDHLNDLGHKVNVTSFWQDDQQHINIEFQEDGEETIWDRKLEIEGILETYGPEDLWAPYSVNAFYQDGCITVKITFES